jgi:hypothetical protein
MANQGPLVGQGVATRLGLKVGDHFKVIVPLTKELDPTQFTRQMSEFVVKGILDLGKYDWNQRFILTDLKSSQASGADATLIDILGSHSNLRTSTMRGRLRFIFLRKWEVPVLYQRLAGRE